MGEQNAEPVVSAADRWYEKHGTWGPDRPDIRVWMPHDTPHVIVQTWTRGDGTQVPVNAPRVLVNVKIGGVDIGGYLDEMVEMFEVVQEALAGAKRYAEALLDAAQSDDSGAAS